ncbi:DUF3306 domain-containing protein [Acuticoccus sp. I52.16.1]|uniref:DUF3306 domain-containing protein n=1 Tax=Acuticoccus sp. I52.16.1 TaxID=2928472 RepID=UPI001FD44D32|nr:DUF3306 domain-containing protein [Acuticoccus sp. I52.16.1]UOM35269.1 DUF3306 domain-containing protein [Acuticoccus sp. I52.16.1]
MSTDNAFERWSRRKRGLPVDAPAPDDTAPAVPQARAAGDGPDEAHAAPLPEEAPESEAQFLERTGLADPETLGPGADFSAYLARTVPAALRRRAMRLLWRSNPVFANLDGLVDYDQDFTDAAASPGIVESAYQALRGYAKADPPPEAPPAAEGGGAAPRQAAESAAPADVAEAAGAADGLGSPASEEDAPPPVAAAPTPDESLEWDGSPAGAAAGPGGPPAAMRPRRMRFSVS